MRRDQERKKGKQKQPKEQQKKEGEKTKKRRDRLIEADFLLRVLLSPTGPGTD